MASVGGGESLSFDPQAVQDALNAVQGIAGDTRNVHARCQRHHQRASGLMNDFRQMREGLELSRLESLWRDLGFDDLRRELAETRSQLYGLRARIEAVRRLLVEAHSGVLGRKLFDDVTPLITGFQTLHDQMDSAVESVIFTEGLRLFEDVVYTLGGIASGALAAAENTDAFHESLTGLKSLEEDLLNLSPDQIWNALSRAQNVHDFLDLLKTLRSKKGISELADLPKPFGVTMALLWGFLANGDISAHGLFSVGIGQAIQYGIYATPAGPAVAFAQDVLAGTAVAGSVLSFGFNAWGQYQGGAWGAADKSAGKSWGVVADDADNAGNVFTDVGSVVYDDSVNGWALLHGSPTPVSYSQFTGDIGHIGRDVTALNNLTNDVSTAATKTVLDVGGQSVEAALKVVHAPAGIQSHVDDFLTHHVANLLTRF